MSTADTVVRRSLKKCQSYNRYLSISYIKSKPSLFHICRHRVGTNGRSSILKSSFIQHRRYADAKFKVRGGRFDINPVIVVKQIVALV